MVGRRSPGNLSRILLHYGPRAQNPMKSEKMKSSSSALVAPHMTKKETRNEDYPFLSA